MSGGAQNVQAAIQHHLKDLSIRKPRAKTAPGYSQIGAGINAIVGSDIKRARRGGVVDLNGPHRQIGKGAADVRPHRAAIRSPENTTRSAKLVDHGVGDESVGGIDLNLIDSGAAHRQIVLRPDRAMAGGNENLAAAGKCSPCANIDRVRV